MKYNSQDESRNEMDYQINKYTLKCLKIMLIVLTILWIMNILNIFIVDIKLMSMAYFIVVAILIITLLCGKLVDLRKKWVKYILITLTTSAIVVLGVTLTYHTLLLTVIPLLIATQYTDKKVLVYTFLLTLIGNFVIVMGGYYWGLCDANMLFLTVKPTSYYMDTASKSLTFESINTNPWYTLSLYYVLPRCILHTLMLPVIQSISKNIKKTEQHAVAMKRLSEIDEMTGLYNRNKFLSMVDREYTCMDKLCVIFWDINYLKQINDSLGHEKGDILITTVGRMLLTLTDVNKKGYRIGGDEFVMVVENPKEGEIDHILQKWEELSKLQSQAVEMDLSVAVGYAFGKGKEVNRIFKKADELMYQKKKEQKRDTKIQI